MDHHATSGFWRSYEKLPPQIKQLADKNFAMLRSNPRHPSLHFKQIGELWSVRVGRSYRALALQDGDSIVWFWIGSHADYDQIVRN